MSSIVNKLAFLNELSNYTCPQPTCLNLGTQSIILAISYSDPIKYQLPDWLHIAPSKVSCNGDMYIEGYT